LPVFDWKWLCSWLLGSFGGESDTLILYNSQPFQSCRSYINALRPRLCQNSVFPLFPDTETHAMAQGIASHIVRL
jgi:hypothetical protein